MATQETVYLRVSQTRSRWGKSPLEIVNEIISRLPEEVRSGGIDSEALLRQAGQSALDHIKRAFLIKSSGGTDEAGDRWEPLSPRTVAYSRKGKSSKGASRPSRALSKRENARWWDLYRHGLAMFHGDKSHAARRAWFILKKEGAATLLDKYGADKVPILYDSGGLFDSIILSIEDGAIIIKATAAYAGAHHHGVPGRIPQRRLWPDPSKWPSSWWESILGAIRDKFAEIIAKRVRGE